MHNVQDKLIEEIAIPDHKARRQHRGLKEHLGRVG